MAPPPAAGAPPEGAPPTTAGGLTKLKVLNLRCTQITDAGCAALAAALDSCALPPLEHLDLDATPFLPAHAAKAAVQRAGLRVEWCPGEQ